MRQTQKVVIYGNPRGKGRPRFAFKGGHAYTDAATTEYEGRVLKAWKCENNFTFTDKAPISVFIKAYFPVPVSYSKKKRAVLFDTPFTGKPDADNIAKIILDGLNRKDGAWKDDAQIDVLVVTKRYVSSDAEQPRVEVEVTGGEE
jgi:Holliday junction resolvase RusA-like endonuclease